MVLHGNVLYCIAQLASARGLCLARRLYTSYINFFQLSTINFHYDDDDDDEDDDDINFKKWVFFICICIQDVFQIDFVKNSKCFCIVFDDFPTKNSFYYTFQWFDLTFIKAFDKS